jgi:hypothetical protein
LIAVLFPAAPQSISKIIFVHAKAFQFEALYFLQRFARDSLQISVHSDSGFHHAHDLFFALCPLPHYRFAFLIEILLDAMV